MDVWEAIETRRTVREFKGAVSEELLRKIIRAGSMAPSGRNSQPWEFIIVNDPEIIDQIAEQKYQNNFKMGFTEEAATRQRNAYRNSSVVAICHKKDELANVVAWMAALNMALAARAEGLGSVMSTLKEESKKAVEKILGLPEDYELATMMVIGVPVNMPQKRESGVDRPEFSWLHVNKFGSAS
ncbi:nitroreductase family protein [Chloroflexota bacterium]